jgi:hypothetical protein
MEGLATQDRGAEARLNEMILRVLCLNQAIEKMQAEMSQLASSKT